MMSQSVSVSMWSFWLKAFLQIVWVFKILTLAQIGEGKNVKIISGSTNSLTYLELMKGMIMRRVRNLDFFPYRTFRLGQIYLVG